MPAYYQVDRNPHALWLSSADGCYASFFPKVAESGDFFCFVFLMRMLGPLLTSYYQILILEACRRLVWVL